MPLCNAARQPKKLPEKDLLGHAHDHGRADANEKRRPEDGQLPLLLYGEGAIFRAVSYR